MAKVEIDAGHAAKSSDQMRDEVKALSSRIATVEGFKTVLATVGGVLGALGLGLAFWLKMMSADIGSVSAAQDTLKKLEVRLADLEKNRDALVRDVMAAAVPSVVKAAQSAAQVPPGTVLLWWPEASSTPIPAGWRQCGKELDGWTPQFENNTQLLGHQASFRATPGNEVVGNQINLSIVRVRCLVRQ